MKFPKKKLTLFGPFRMQDSNRKTLLMGRLGYEKRNYLMLGPQFCGGGVMKAAHIIETITKFTEAFNVNDLDQVMTFFQ